MNSAQIKESLVGQVLDNVYRVDRLAGEGGMAIVFEGFHLSFEERVAIKVPKPEILFSSGVLERFRREAVLLRKVSHENIVRVYDVRMAEQSMQNVCYIAMEFIEATKLDDFLRENDQRLYTGDVMRLFRGAAEAIDVAHGFNIIHRDIKPENILVTKQREIPKVVDFGLARDIESDANLTQNTAAIFTPAYASPEQCRGGIELGPATDIYSYAMTMYRCMARKPPFDAKTATEFQIAQIREEPMHLCDRNSKWPRAVGDVLAKGLAKKPEQRPAKAVEMVTQMEAALGPMLATPFEEFFAQPKASRTMVFVPGALKAAIAKSEDEKTSPSPITNLTSGELRKLLNDSTARELPPPTQARTQENTQLSITVPGWFGGLLSGLRSGEWKKKVKPVHLAIMGAGIVLFFFVFVIGSGLAIFFGTRKSDKVIAAEIADQFVVQAEVNTMDYDPAMKPTPEPSPTPFPTPYASPTPEPTPTPYPTPIPTPTPVVIYVTPEPTVAAEVTPAPAITPAATSTPVPTPESQATAIAVVSTPTSATPAPVETTSNTALIETSTPYPAVPLDDGFTFRVVYARGHECRVIVFGTRKEYPYWKERTDEFKKLYPSAEFFERDFKTASDALRTMSMQMQRGVTERINLTWDARDIPDPFMPFKVHGYWDGRTFNTKSCTVVSGTMEIFDVKVGSFEASNSMDGSCIFNSFRRKAQAGRMVDCRPGDESITDCYFNYASIDDPDFYRFYKRWIEENR